MYFLLGFFPFLTLTFIILRLIIDSTLAFDQINALSLAYIVICILILMVAKISVTKDFLVFFLVSVVALSLTANSIVLNIDRSRSMYVLGWVRSNLVTEVNGNFDYRRVQSSEKFSTSQIDQRLNEQVARGLIVKSEEKLSLSILGRFIVAFADGGATLFNLDGWYKNNH